MGRREDKHRFILPLRTIESVQNLMPDTLLEYKKTNYFVALMDNIQLLIDHALMSDYG